MRLSAAKIGELQALAQRISRSTRLISCVICADHMSAAAMIELVSELLAEISEMAQTIARVTQADETA